jgi:hypothetical protein
MMIEKMYHVYYGRFLNKKRLRPMMQYTKDQNGSNIEVGVEIGVAYGDHALSMLSNIPSITRLYLIDPYVDFIDDDGVTANFGDIGLNRAKKKLSKFEDKITFIREYSEKAVESIPKGLDFVYIDGNHNYEYVKQDIALYYPLVKPGGILGGHDANHVSVLRAFFELVNEKKIKDYFVGAYCMSECPDWWVVKK